jgi:hypothetical protein
MNDDPKPTPLSFKVAVIATLLVPVAGLVIAIAARQWVIFPGALVSLVLYAVLGYFALKGREWARWILFAFMLVIAMLGVVFTFVRLGGGSSSVGFNPWIAVIPVFYGLVAAGLAVRPRRLAS